MDFRDFKFAMSIDGATFDPTPEDMSFSISDSLFSFLCKAEFTLMDRTSTFLEYRLFNDGISFNLSFSSSEDETLECKYVVDNNESPAVLQTGILSTKLKANLIHESFSMMSKASDTTEGSTSDAVQAMVDNLPFNDTIIAASGGTASWYRPLMTEQEFIENILLQRSMSDADEYSPFFAFTTSDNIFHFEDLSTLMSKSVKEEFIYQPYSEDTYTPGTLTTLLPYSKGITKTRKNWHRKIDGFNRADFTAIEVERLLPDRFKESSLIVGDNTLITDEEYIEFLDLDDTLDKTRVFGHENYVSRGSFFQESFFISTMRPFTNLHSGDKIKLTVTTNDVSGYSDSLYMTGEYIIETSSHVWNGEKEVGYSEFVISRSSAVVPSDHLVGKKFIK